ncbi:Thioredoxin-like [Pedobacter steynii]|uniref:Thioredoxin-like n=1 Tax=Pedobacter steynii TaxID=430522 RepID=A0A1G9UQ14_9SPHI|nr:TlpA disulfide reductase family protein [Pedobacter steynii]NQX40837.1 TlpA family protein disulfide reductase [Pedobacter steynii]SDM61956.1 Thioredoxin-like [Pedobacter steynii]
MKNNFIGCFFILFTLSNALFASPPKKLIQIKFPSGIANVILAYRDSAFNEKLIAFSNPAKKDTVISQTLELAAGQVLTHSAYVNSGLIKQSFILPENDTLRLEIGTDWKLKLIAGIRFFIEDTMNLYYEFPGQPASNKMFLDKGTGLSLTKSIFQNNQSAIEKSYSSGVLNPNEQAILLSIAKADYYFRLVSWALKNQTVDEISGEMEGLVKDKDQIQLVRSTGAAQLFGGYVMYMIRRDHLNSKDTRKVVKAILDLGWKKNISFGYIRHILSDLQAQSPAVLAQCYKDLSEYLDGDFPLELAALRKKILPVLQNMDKVMLIAPDGKRLSFKQLLDKNKNKYLLIDFWASWCVPCREEAPLFEKAKADLAGQNMVLVSISTDEDDKVNDWKKALKADGLLKATNHYKLIKPKDNPLFKSFGLPSIPRYILINSKGEFINPDFPRPSDTEFKKALSQIIASSN